MAPPLPLSPEQYLLFAVGLELHNRAAKVGATILKYPLPNCPICGETPNEIVSCVDGFSFAAPRSVLAELSCGHSFGVSEETVWGLQDEVQRIADSEWNRPAGPQEQPASSLFNPADYWLNIGDDDMTIFCRACDEWIFKNPDDRHCQNFGGGPGLEEIHAALQEHHDRHHSAEQKGMPCSPASPSSSPHTLPASATA